MHLLVAQFFSDIYIPHHVSQYRDAAQRFLEYDRDTRQRTEQSRWIKIAYVIADEDGCWRRESPFEVFHL